MRYYNKFQWSLKPYRLASHKIWSVTPQERDEYLKLDWNEATIQPSPCVSKRIHQLLEVENFYNLYPDMINPELNDLLSKYVGLPEDYIRYFCGSDVVHECIVRSYIAPGDSVLILGPSYDNFRLTAESAGGKRSSRPTSMPSAPPSSTSAPPTTPPVTCIPLSTSSTCSTSIPRACSCWMRPTMSSPASPCAA